MNHEFRFLMYRSAEEDVAVNAVSKDETVWLTQKAMAELFDVDKSTINRRLKNIFWEGELDEKAVVAKIATTTPDGAIAGKTQTTDSQFYNLDAIISMGWRAADRGSQNKERRGWEFFSLSRCIGAEPMCRQFRPESLLDRKRADNPRLGRVSEVQ